MPKKVSRARSPEQANNLLVSLAYKVAEQKLRDGTASSQLICEVLKRGTEKYRLENEKLKAEVDVANAKIKHMEAEVANGEVYRQAMEAFKRYAGSVNYHEDDYVIDEDEEDY